MRISQLNPIDVQSHISGLNNSDDMIKDCIVVGKCKNDIYYSSELIFPPILINDDEIVRRAVLKMFCKRECGAYDNINVCINNDNVCIDVEGIDTYEWDVTNIVNHMNKEHLKLCAYTRDLINPCGIKEFEFFDYTTRPVLELTFSYRAPQPKRKVVDIVREYWVDNTLRYSGWIDSSWLDTYYYFIKNLGNNEVEIILEISPDKHLILQDSEALTIEPDEVAYIQPMRASQFVRLSYKNASINSPNLIKVWLQGEK